MSDFSVNHNVLSEEIQNLRLVYKMISDQTQKMESIKNTLNQMLVYHDVVSTLKTVITDLNAEQNYVKKLCNTLELIVLYYEKTESVISSNHSDERQSKNNTVNQENTVWDQLDKLMDSANHYMQDFRDRYNEIVQAAQDAIAINGVVAIGISSSIGAGGYLCGSVQLVVDMNGNVGLQFSGGAGAEAGASADGTVYAAVYPGMKNISETEGFGTDMGGSFGEAFVGSAGILSAGEGNDMKPVGGYVGVGIGGEGTVAEGHVSMSETLPTIPLGNIYTNKMDSITNTWNMAYNAWEYLYEKQ